MNRNSLLHTTYPCSNPSAVALDLFSSTLMYNGWFFKEMRAKSWTFVV